MSEKKSYDNLLFRCSSLSKLFVEPRGKSPKEKAEELRAEIDKLSAEIKEKEAEGKGELKTIKDKRVKLTAKQSELINLEKRKDDPAELLSESTKTHLIDIYVSVKYGRRSELKSKYVKKGNIVEEDGITLISSHFGKFFSKNTVRKENGYITGEADIVEGDGAMRNEAIYDNKSSWDIFTFMRSKFDQEIDNNYWWQMQGYGILWMAPKLHLCYTLIDTPESVIDSEIRNLWYSLGQPPDDDEFYTECKIELMKKMIYTDIPLKERIAVKSFDTMFNLESDIEQRVKLCRAYMKEYLPL